MKSVLGGFFALALVSGCSDPMTAADAFVAVDGGHDAHVALLDVGFDSPPATDASRADAAPPIDVGTDAPSTIDAGHDAAMRGDAGNDAAVVPDSGCATGAPTCAALPPSCHYDDSLDPCRCGMVICDVPAPCSPACSGTEFCMYADGTCDGTGTCTVRPDVCSDVADPVCGCDGHTYQNACDASAAGQSVLYHGACATPTDCRSVGCEAGFSCRSCRGAGNVCIADGDAC